MGIMRSFMKHASSCLVFASWYVLSIQIEAAGPQRSSHSPRFEKKNTSFQFSVTTMNTPDSNDFEDVGFLDGQEIRLMRQTLDRRVSAVFGKVVQRQRYVP
jgi:hypothetical protein